MEKSIQRAAAIDTSILFVRNQQSKHETLANNIKSAFSNNDNINTTSEELNETQAVHLSDLNTIQNYNNLSKMDNEVKRDENNFINEENAIRVPSYQKIQEIAKNDHIKEFNSPNVVLVNDVNDSFKDDTEKQTQQDEDVDKHLQKSGTDNNDY